MQRAVANAVVKRIAIARRRIRRVFQARVAVGRSVRRRALWIDIGGVVIERHGCVDLV
jgi:hypothetical protein